MLTNVSIKQQISVIWIYIINSNYLHINEELCMKSGEETVNGVDKNP